MARTAPDALKGVIPDFRRDQVMASARPFRQGTRRCQYDWSRRLK
jgi:hypothetical protein